MNKVILMGRLTKDPEVRYTSTKTAVCRYSLAVNRQYKKEGEQEADFLNVVAFGKAGEFAGKYFVKGQQVAVVGRLQTGSYTDRNGVKRYTTDIIAEEQHFAESKRKEAFEPTDEPIPDNFYPDPEQEGLPF